MFFPTTFFRTKKNQKDLSVIDQLNSSCDQIKFIFFCPHSNAMHSIATTIANGDVTSWLICHETTEVDLSLCCLSSRTELLNCANGTVLGDHTGA